ncbi:MAG: hypothetical protein JW741_20210 [Sedimentisphaerales bacterium]|nr:hypothetical protein [Sedimentisphaerales bacterium]
MKGWKAGKLMTYTRLSCYVRIMILVYLAAATGPARGADAERAATDDLWDPQRYIGVDEIQRDMEGYCLTDYGDGGIEKFPVKVVNVVREYEPGHDLILVMGLDDRFKHTGPVAGCSGSPVYLSGRLAGALSRGWSLQKDPLYGVTPIRDMLQVGTLKGSPSSGQTTQAAALSLDFSKPVNPIEVDKQITRMRALSRSNRSGPTALPCPLQISGLPIDACRQLAPQFEALGFAAVPGLSGTAQSDEATSFAPGGVLTIPLVAGDVRIDTLGTVTEVRGNRIYGFGHSFEDFGATNLPLAGGQVYTVVSQLTTSFKLGAAGDIIGAITMDNAVGIYGEIGAEAKMVPLTVHVQPSNGAQARTYNCRVAYNPLLTPLLVRATVAGATLPFNAALPPDHTVQYSVAVHLEDGRSVEFANTSTGSGLAEPVAEINGTLSLLLNNPYGGPDIKSVEADIRVATKNIDSYLWSVNVADSTVKPGRDIEIEAVVESYLKEKRRYQAKLTVPEDVPAGKYNLMLLGGYEYENFLRKAAPHHFVATNSKTLVEALNDALNINRARLYCVLALPPEGISMDRAELPGFPETKSMILKSNKWAIPTQPYARWVEKVVETDTIIMDKEVIPIIVETDGSERPKVAVGD